MVTGMKYKIHFVAGEKCKYITFSCKMDNVRGIWPWFGLLKDEFGIFNEDRAAGFIETYHRW